MSLYKKNIDGLRAIAVCSVIFYHATLEVFGIRLFPGGYLGVDIFFVISGYLITLIIVTDRTLGTIHYSLNKLIWSKSLFKKCLNIKNIVDTLVKR